MLHVVPASSVNTLRRGALVHAFDITPKMVELARQRCASLPVGIVEGDLCAPLIWLSDGFFDKVVCSLAFDYVADLQPVFRELRRVARAGATLVFSMSHPMRDWIDERNHANATYFEVARFGSYWSGFGEPKPYVQVYRRSLSDILNGLTKVGWTIDCLVEPRPLEEMVAISEQLYADLSREPTLICVRARADC